MSGVFDDQKAMPLGDFDQSIHVARSAVELGGHDGACPVGDRLRHGFGRDEVIRSAFDGYRGGAREVNGGRRCKHRVRRENHFIAGADAGGQQSDLQAVGGIPDAESIADTQKPGKRLLELGQIPLLDVRSPAADVAQDRYKLLFIRGE